MITNIHRSSRKVLVMLVTFQLKLNSLGQIFEKRSNIKFQENLLEWQPSCFIRTERHVTKIIVAFSIFFERS